MKENLTEKEREILKNVENWAKEKYERNIIKSHSLEHTKRVVDNVVEICRHEDGGKNEFSITLAAWLHDLGRIPESMDNQYRNRPIKSYQGHALLSVWEAREKLKELRDSGVLTSDQWKQILYAIVHHSHLRDSKRRTRILEIVQDADRLDVFGLDGLIRCLCHAKEHQKPIEKTELPFDFSDSDFRNLQEKDCKSVLSDLWYNYKKVDGWYTKIAERKVLPKARAYRDFIDLLQKSLAKNEGYNYQFWFDFLEYAKKKSLERLTEKNLEDFKQINQ